MVQDQTKPVIQDTTESTVTIVTSLENEKIVTKIDLLFQTTTNIKVIRITRVPTIITRNTENMKSMTCQKDMFTIRQHINNMIVIHPTTITIGIPTTTIPTVFDLVTITLEITLKIRPDPEISPIILITFPQVQCQFYRAQGKSLL